MNRFTVMNRFLPSDIKKQRIFGKNNQFAEYCRREPVHAVMFQLSMFLYLLITYEIQNKWSTHFW